ncbi:MAG: ABC transporter substrate-binding protein [Deltaproteobacteria bacterium]|nr:ABC transporter substrate-binding protein [Deltaproteobacteria bacterium]
MKRTLLFAATLGVLGAASACSLVIGSLDECKVDGDCAKKGPGLVCQDSLCVASSAPVDAGVDAGPAVARDPLCQDVYGSTDGGNVLRLGAVVPKSTSTGAVDIRGVYRGDAIAMAVQELNRKSALPGTSVVIRVCDDTGDSTKAATEAGELLDEGAVALVTTGSSQTIAIANAVVSRGATLMSISATSTQIQSAGVLPDGGAKRVWSTATSDSSQAKVLAGMMEDAGYSRPACVHADDVAFNGLYASLTQDLPAFADGGANLPQFLYESGTSPTSAIQGAQQSSPDAVVLISTVGDTAALLGAWEGADPVWLFTDNARSTSVYGFDGGLARLAGSKGTGPSTPSASNLEYSSFHALFVTDFPDAGDPATVSYVPNAYDAVLLLAAGSLWAQGHGTIDGAGVAQGLTQLSNTSVAATPLSADQFTTLAASFSQGQQVNVKGASGALDFDNAHGVAPGPIDIWVIAPDGGIVTVANVANP